MQAHARIEVDPRLEETLAELETRELRAADGTVLPIYMCGPERAPRVVIVNPLGVPIVISTRLMRLLGASYRVVCWQQRGCSGSSKEIFARPHDYDSYVGDLLAVAHDAGPELRAVVGICSGAALALRAVAQRQLQVPRLLLVSPAVRFDAGYVASTFDRTVVPYMEKISRGQHSIARQLLDLRAASAASAETKDSDEALLLWADKWGMRSFDALLVYARTVHTFHAQRMDADFRAVRQPVALFAAMDDSTVAIESVRRMTRLLPAASLSEYPKGGHFMVFTSEAARQEIRAAIDRADSP